MTTLLKRFVCETDGQDLIEYTLLAAVIALGAVGGMLYVKNMINTEFTKIGNTITAGS